MISYRLIIYLFSSDRGCHRIYSVSMHEIMSANQLDEKRYC